MIHALINLPYLTHNLFKLQSYDVRPTRVYYMTSGENLDVFSTSVKSIKEDFEKSKLNIIDYNKISEDGLIYLIEEFFILSDPTINLLVFKSDKLEVKNDQVKVIRSPEMENTLNLFNLNRVSSEIIKIFDIQLSLIKGILIQKKIKPSLIQEILELQDILSQKENQNNPKPNGKLAKEYTVIYKKFKKECNLSGFLINMQNFYHKIYILKKENNEKYK